MSYGQTRLGSVRLGRINFRSNKAEYRRKSRKLNCTGQSYKFGRTQSMPVENIIFRFFPAKSAE